MSGRVGDKINGELWLRCPYCGDSQNDPEKAHFSINLKSFVFHCFRCNESGRLTTKQIFSLLSTLSGDMDLTYVMDNDDRNPEDDFPELMPGAGSGRKSLLDRFHWKDQTGHTWDAFEMRHPKDNVVTGVHLRSGKHKLSLGDKTANWTGEGPLLSQDAQPIHLVEGPYDVVRLRDVCVYGLISRATIEQFAGHSVILCPDGDVWAKKDLFELLVRTVKTAMSSRLVYLVGLERIPEDTDPEDEPERRFIAREAIWERLMEWFLEKFSQEAK